MFLIAQSRCQSGETSPTTPVLNLIKSLASKVQWSNSTERRKRFPTGSNQNWSYSLMIQIASQLRNTVRNSKESTRIFRWLKEETSNWKMGEDQRKPHLWGSFSNLRRQGYSIVFKIQCILTPLPQYPILSPRICTTKPALSAGKSAWQKTTVSLIFQAISFLGYQCNHCHWSGEKCSIRYTTRFKIADYSGSLFAVGFEGPANVILKKTAEEIKSMADLDKMKLEAYLKTVTNQDYSMGIKVANRTDQQNNIRIKYTILWARPINQRKQNQCMID